MDDFPPNSKKSKNPPPVKKPKEIKKIVTTPVVVRKKPFGTKFKEVFVGADAKTSLMYVTHEVLIPALRNMVVEATSRGIERIIYGESRPRPPSSPMFGGGPKISYNSPVTRFPGQRSSPFMPSNPIGRYGQGDQKKESPNLMFVTRAEAEQVLEMMGNILEEYEVISIGDLCELTGLASSHIDQTWGWTDLRGTNVKQTRDGYTIDFPPVEPV